ncbi:N amino acid transport system protein [Lachnellula subtilissima]|uniref:N amino acid transport system protein n=1 Tax=Lachnellula subtilissima TaxID=602034 RepID=A0A8H8RP62_9HELO|nr:N amino acid transport system protein [Lachnellula subtilissima]
MSNLANLALDGGDPRLSKDAGDAALRKEEGVFSTDSDQGITPAIRPQNRAPHDASISFAEYAYYAARTRAEEEEHVGDIVATQSWVQMIFPSKSGMGASNVSGAEKHGAEINANTNLAKAENRDHITAEEWTNASRALRTATKSAIFYLITTDILGPFGLPYAFATTGWGPGITLFTIFGVLAGYSGYLLWKIFMGMDSYEFPIKTYGDMGFRLMGRWTRYLFNVLQSIQLILSVGLIIVSNGEALSQAAKFKLCFAICCLVWTLAGFFFGQVRTLQKFGWLANAAVWINVICMIITMGAAAHTAPNYKGAAESAGATLNNGTSITPDSNGVFPAVQHSGGLPPSGDFAGSVNGAMQAVFSYGGAMIFPEFMSEMRYPRDFLKGMWAAQSFIYIIYMFYGLFMYGYQGQYVINPSYLGIGKYNFQTAGNVFAMISALIAAALYGNIGIKVMYNSIFVELFHAPPLSTKAGKLVWVGLIPVYWSIAFVIAAGIPDFSGLTGIVAAVCILQFTYTFPPMLSIAYMMNKNTAGEFDPATGTETKTGKGFLKGFFADKWYMNCFNLVYMLGALAMAGLGSYAAIENLINAFKSGASNSFVCKSPLDG